MAIASRRFIHNRVEVLFVSTTSVLQCSVYDVKEQFVILFGPEECYFVRVGSRQYSTDGSTENFLPKNQVRS
jgi:hypothetical protein